MKKLFSSVLILLMISGCADSVTDIDGDISDAVIKITDPVDNDSIGYKGSLIEYELKTFTGINFLELYINNTFIENFPPVNNQKPVIRLNIDSSFMGSKIELYLVYYDKNGISYKSNIVRNVLVTKDKTPPSVPTGLKVIRIGPGTINLSWQDSSPYVTGYEVWRREGSAAEFVKHITTPPGTRNINDENLAEDIVYYYKVRTVAENGLSDFSSIVNSTGSGGSPDVPAPSNLKAAVTGDKVVRLTWKDNSDNENYFKIERRRDWTAYEGIGYAPKNSSAYTDSASGLTGGAEYYYRVKAVSENDSSWSNEAYLLMPSYFLQKPVITALTNDASRKVTVKWKDNDQYYADFIIERRTGEGQFSETAVVPGNVNIYQDAVEPSRKYTYRIKQVLGSLSSGYSDEAVIETKVIQLAAPSDLNGYYDGAAMIISWQYKQDADSFIIERMDTAAGSSFTHLGTAGGEERIFSDNTTKCQQVYIYRVKAVDPYSASPYSSEKALKNWQLCP